jgi:signal transduction histidine kinase
MERDEVEYEPSAQELLEALDHISKQDIELRDTITHRFLHEASAVLSASLDYDTTLCSIARIAVPRVADCCAVDLVQDDAVLHRVAVAHRSHEKENLVWIMDRYNVNPPGVFGRSKVLRTGRSELYAHVTDDLLRAIAENSEHLRGMRQLNFKSFMCVPLKARGRVLGTLSFMRDSDGAPYGPPDLALAEDLASRAAMAVDNAMLYLREQEANRLKDEFLATVSHELRTPLTPIFGALYLLRSMTGTDKKAQAALDVIDRNAKLQASIVEDLLDISKMSGGRLELDRTRVDLLPIIDSALDLVRPAAEALGIHLDVALETPTRQIYCDAARIQQVITNLLSNAIKFTNAGGRIEVRTENRSAGIRIVISDTGRGITRQFLPHVFERFRQAETFSTRREGGLGLGLSIVRYIVEQHGGAVWAQSEGEGQGATFIVDLPFS